MNRLPARTGLQWIRQGFALFGRHPADMLTLFLTYVVVMFVIGLIPLLGQLLPMMLIPAFSIGFMQACALLERGERVRPMVAFTGLRSPAFPRLFQLGVLHLLAAMLAIGASTLIDDGSFWKVISSRKNVDPRTIDAGALFRAMLTALLVYIPAAMALWYSAALVYWQKMGVGKSLFYSFFAVWRAFGAFLTFGLGWLGIGVILPTFISVILAALTGAPAVAMFLLLPVSVLLTVVMYCSFYPTYTAVFGPLEQQPAPAAQPPEPPAAE